MWRDFLTFLPLAVLANTAFPLSFDPVLLYFAGRHPLEAGGLFAACGSLCAGMAGVIDVRLAGRLRRAVAPRQKPSFAAWRGRWFYLGVFLYAVSPLPFTVVRLSLLWRRPDPALYGLAVTLGRLPRYLLTVYFWQSLALPSYFGVIILAGALLFALHRWKASPAKAGLTILSDWFRQITHAPTRADTSRFPSTKGAGGGHRQEFNQR